MEKSTISLKAARVNANYTLKDVAIELNVVYMTVRNWELGITAIPANIFFKLCRLYGLNSDLVEVPKVKDGKYNE